MRSKREISILDDDEVTAPRRARLAQATDAAAVTLPRIGIHTSSSGNRADALENARKLGANCLQIFSASPRMWGHSPRIAEADAARFRDLRAELGHTPTVIHANYLINLATPSAMMRTQSVQAFHAELVRALDLGADFLVLHPGSRLGEPLAPALSALADGLRQAVRGLKLKGLQILLENTAGQGTCLGSRFEELAAVRQACPDLPLGICLDTAHLLAAGFDIRSADALENTLYEIERTVGLKNVRVIHVNDSKTPLGSRVDRHEHIGKGHIGLEAFARILTHPLLAGRAFILETPIDRPGDDRRNVEALWKMVVREGMSVPKHEQGFTMFRGHSRGAVAKPSPRRKTPARRLAEVKNKPKSASRRARVAVTAAGKRSAKEF
jgi:deoxyribonuclease-4